MVLDHKTKLDCLEYVCDTEPQLLEDSDEKEYSKVFCSLHGSILSIVVYFISTKLYNYIANVNMSSYECLNKSTHMHTYVLCMLRLVV